MRLGIQTSVAFALAAASSVWLTPAHAQANVKSDRGYYYVGGNFGRMDTNIDSSS